VVSDADATARLTAYVSGRVQGVGFRAWVRDRATELGLVGSARNLPDGRVEIVAAGTREVGEALLAELHGRAAPGTVDHIDAKWDAIDAVPPGFTTG
jgi:acylphosphatase